LAPTKKKKDKKGYNAWSDWGGKLEPRKKVRRNEELVGKGKRNLSKTKMIGGLIAWQ